MGIPFFHQPAHAGVRNENKDGQSNFPKPPKGGGPIGIVPSHVRLGKRRGNPPSAREAGVRN